MDNKKENKPQQINIELSPELEATYSNLAIISHSISEFIIDFTLLLPGIPRAKVKSRIVMTPQHAKLLMHALTDNIHKFEQIHGEIVTDGSVGNSPFPGFTGLPN